VQVASLPATAAAVAVVDIVRLALAPEAEQLIIRLARRMPVTFAGSATAAADRAWSGRESDDGDGTDGWTRGPPR